MLLVAAFQLIVLGFIVDECLGCFGPLGTFAPPGPGGCGLRSAREVKLNVNISYTFICYIKLKQHIPAIITKAIKRC